MRHKYLPPSKSTKRWSTAKFAGDEDRRDKYYAFLKHRSQARYRGESYELTWEDWEHLWDDSSWQLRGQRIGDLCLTRIDFAGEWAIHNVIVCTRKDHFAIKSGTYDK